MGKNFGPILSCLWSKVHDILRECRKPLVVSNALVRLCISGFIPKISAVKVAVKLRSRRK